MSIVRGLSLRNWISVSISSCYLLVPVTAARLWQNRTKLRTETATNYLGSFVHQVFEDMKLYYSKDRQRYEVSEQGRLIDHDHNMAVLMNRNGWDVADELVPTEFTGDDRLTDEEIATLFAGLGEENAQ